MTVVPLNRADVPVTATELIDVETEFFGASLGVVRVRGEVDMLTVGRLSSALQDAQAAFDQVVLDLSAVTFWSSLGLDAVISASRGGTLRVFAPTMPARQLFEICAPALLADY